MQIFGDDEKHELYGIREWYYDEMDEEEYDFVHIDNSNALLNTINDKYGLQLNVKEMFIDFARLTSFPDALEYLKIKLREDEEEDDDDDYDGVDSDEGIAKNMFLTNKQKHPRREPEQPEAPWTLKKAK